MTIQRTSICFVISMCRCFFIPVLSVLAIVFWVAGGAAHAVVSTETSAGLQKLSIPFVENQGQINPQVSHYAQTFAGTLYVTNSGDLVLALPQGNAGDTRYLTIARDRSIAGTTGCRTCMV